MKHRLVGGPVNEPTDNQTDRPIYSGQLVADARALWPPEQANLPCLPCKGGSLREFVISCLFFNLKWAPIRPNPFLGWGNHHGMHPLTCAGAQPFALSADKFSWVWRI